MKLNVCISYSVKDREYGKNLSYIILNYYTEEKGKTSLLPIVEKNINAVVELTGRYRLINYIIRDFDQNKIKIFFDNVKENKDAIVMLTCFGNNIESVFEFLKKKYRLEPLNKNF